MKETTSSKPIIDVDEELERASAIAVKEYLLANPGFFQQFPQLLEKIKIPHKRRGSVSLVELQSEKLRSKNRLLKHKVLQMMETASHNEHLYKIYTNLNLKLLKCRDIIEVEMVLSEVFLDQLRLAAATVKTFVGANAIPEIQRTFFREKRFRTRPYFFGRLSAHEMALLFDHQQNGSVAMMLLGENRELGILAIASDDDNHFHPEMDTLLIGQLQRFLTTLLPNLLDL